MVYKYTSNHIGTHCFIALSGGLRGCGRISPDSNSVRLVLEDALLDFTLGEDALVFSYLQHLETEPLNPILSDENFPSNNNFYNQRMLKSYQIYPEHVVLLRNLDKEINKIISKKINS